MSVIPFPYNLIIAGVAVLAIVLTTFAFTRGHYVAKYDVLKATYTQEGKDFQKTQDDKQIQDNYVTKEANDALKTHDALASANADRLSNDALSQPLKVCAGHIPNPPSNPGTTTSDSSKGAGTVSATLADISINPTLLDDILASSIDNTQALIIISKWEDQMKLLEQSK